MHIILGATGHVGSAVAAALLKLGEQITVITHDAKKETAWKQKGAGTAVADVHDTAALREVFRRGKRLFLLNPPADPSGDTVKEEQATLASILEALEGSGIEKVVAESTYGARPGEGTGDLGVLYDMEKKLAEQPVPASIIRAAYYMSNWDASLETARQEGKVPTLYPAAFKLPMVAPHDIGELAARLLTAPVASTGLHYIEGPETYSAADVADAYGAALQQPVEAMETPREQWVQALRQMGFSAPAAASMAAMTATTLEERFDKPDAPHRGAITLQAYIKTLVHKNNAR